MLARALEGRIVLMRRTGLRDVRDLAPHDRVDHLEPLPRDGLQRLAVRHAAVAAPRVVLAPPKLKAFAAALAVLSSASCTQNAGGAPHRAPAKVDGRCWGSQPFWPRRARRVVSFWPDGGIGRRSKDVVLFRSRFACPVKRAVSTGALQYD